MPKSETKIHRYLVHNNIWLALDVTDSMCTVEVYILICIRYDIMMTIRVYSGQLFYKYIIFIKMSTKYENQNQNILLCYSRT